MNISASIIGQPSLLILNIFYHICLTNSYLKIKYLEILHVPWNLIYHLVKCGLIITTYLNESLNCKIQVLYHTVIWVRFTGFNDQPLRSFYTQPQNLCYRIKIHKIIRYKKEEKVLRNTLLNSITKIYWDEVNLYLKDMYL